MKYLMKACTMTFAITFAASFAAKAQYGMMAGGACPYQQDIGEDAMSVQDDIRDANDMLKDLKADLRDAKSDVKEFQRKLDRAKQDFERRGLQSDFAEKVESHIENGAKCTDYQEYMIPGGADVSSTSGGSRHSSSSDKDISGADMSLAADIAGPQSSNAHIIGNRMPANSPSEDNGSTASVSGGGQQTHSPFTTDEWNSVCDPYRKGRVNDGVCSIGRAQVDRLFNAQVCRKSIHDMIEAKKNLDAAQAKQANLESAIEQKKEDIAGLKRDLRDAIKEHKQDLRDQMTEGGCVDCMLSSSGYQIQPRDNSSSTGAILTNLGLGIASMYLGNQMQKTVAGYNARLGFPTQPIPSFGFGYPFIMAGVGAAIAGGAGGSGYYGAIGSAGGSGAFGCASAGMGAGMYGPGGVMGYPGAMYGNPMMGGGMYMPGMGTWGMNGPMMGMNGMFPGGLMGGMGMMMPGMGGMVNAGIGFYTGGAAGMGMPMMGGYPMGGMAGIGMMGGMGMPMMGGYPMGGMAGIGGVAGIGMMAPGMMGGMGMPMMGGYPMGGMGGIGMMAPGMGMPMMGGYPMGGMAGIGGVAGIGMMAPGMMGGMGMPMMGGYPMGGMAGMGMMAPGMMGGAMAPGMMGGMGAMGGMDMAQMQMQFYQQQMQMQMQQMQLQMQMQQRAQENYMARYQTVMGLQSELQGLMVRLQQAQMSLQYGGYTDISLGTSMGTYYGGSTMPPFSTPGQPVYPTPGTITPQPGTGTGSQSVR